MKSILKKYQITKLHKLLKSPPQKSRTHYPNFHHLLFYIAENGTKPTSKTKSPITKMSNIGTKLWKNLMFGGFLLLNIINVLHIVSAENNIGKWQNKYVFFV